MKFLVKTVTALEFDLWMIERQLAKKELRLSQFQAYIKEKYGSFLDRQFENFKKFDLYHITSYEEIAKELVPYQKKIMEFHEKFYQLHKARIDLDHEEVPRTKDYEIIGESREWRSSRLEIRRVETGEAKIGEIKTGRAGSTEGTEEKNTGKTDRETDIILREKEERIDRLEKDIKEFKRQRDEAREYSISQYDKGIKDLFGMMNDIRYGKVIDHLFSLLHRDDIDDELAGYLENFFMLLEDMEIEPIAEYEDEILEKENITKNYNLDFDKKNYKAGGVKIKYVGWKYKDVPMEKPTLALKEEN